MSANIDAKLVKLAFEAVRSADAWQNLLQHLIANTPAKAAIITLRDRQSCQIVNDDSLEREFHSPLIQGFSLDAVLFYLNELRTIDPWAEAQRSHHPHRPTLMSSVCDPRVVSDRRFFDWLESHGMRDSIVFELDRVPGHWTAINLFLGDIGGADSFRLLEYCDAHQSILREAWHTSQHVVQCRQSESATLEQFDHWQMPACISNARGELIRCNETFQSLAAQGVVRVSGPAQTLSLAQDCAVNPNSECDAPIPLRHGPAEVSAFLSASKIHPDPLYSEKKQNLWLMRFQVGEGRSDKMRITYPVEVLTAQEKRLFEAISAGLNVTDAGVEIGIRRSRTFDVWSSIKSKLGIDSAHQLRGHMSAQASLSQVSGLV